MLPKVYRVNILLLHIYSYEELLESSDEEEEEVSRPNRKPAQSRRKQPGGMKGSGQAKAWIKEEGNEDDPVNFMDPVAVKSILGGWGVGRGVAVKRILGTIK